MFVLVVIFWVEQATTPKWFMSMYEYLMRSARSDHVGLTLGHWSQANGLQLLPYDVSAWAGRMSGASLIQHLDCDAKVHAVRATCGYVFPLPHTTALQNLFAPFLGIPSTSVFDTQSRYPTLWDMVGDALRYSCGLVGTSDEAMQRLQEEVGEPDGKLQCAQLTVVMLLQLASQCPNSILHGNGHENLYRLRRLLRQRTALLPGTLQKLLAEIFQDASAATYGHFAFDTGSLVNVLSITGGAKYVPLSSCVLAAPGEVSMTFSSDLLGFVDEGAKIDAMLVRQVHEAGVPGGV